MKSGFLLSLSSMFLLCSCLSTQPKEISLKKVKKPITYKKFMQAISQSDVEEINSLLDFHCEFKQYPGMDGWYGFYRNEKLMIGPFPLKDYQKVTTLSLTRPIGFKNTDYSCFHVFSQSYDLYLYFGQDRVWIEGSGSTGSKPAKMYIY